MQKISIIGFGKIGQAIAAHILKHEIEITAIDTDKRLQLLFKEKKFVSKEPGVTEILIAAYKENKLTITEEVSAVRGSGAIIVAIPLMIDREKKLVEKPFIETCKRLANYLGYQTPVIIETSMPVGFCRNFVTPAFESLGKKHGLDFLLAHSPERIKSGTMMQQLVQIPKVIGGLTNEAADAAYHIYQSFFEESLLHKVESIEAAELIKLAGMIYRDFNIALSNQLAQFADTAGVQYADLIQLINTDKEAALLNPGIGVGGHCTPVYPYFLIENFKQAGLDFSLAIHSRRVNDAMPEYALSLVKDKVTVKKALILGLSFRPNVKEDAVSITYLLHDVLNKEGFEVKVHDTEYTEQEIIEKGFNATALYNSGAEVVFVVTMHKEYFAIDFEKLFKSGVRYLVDGRNNMDRDKVKLAGIEYYGIGR